MSEPGDMHKGVAVLFGFAAAIGVLLVGVAAWVFGWWLAGVLR